MSSRTPVTRPISENQVINRDGGFAYLSSDEARLVKWLLCGVDAGALVIPSLEERRRRKEPTIMDLNREAFIEAAGHAYSMLRSDPAKVLTITTRVSERGRARKNDQAIAVLAMAMDAHLPLSTRKMACEVFQRIVRTGTHLFQFLNCVQKFRGWGRSLKRTVAQWFTSKSEDELILQLVKYRGREGWTMTDVIRQSHPVGSKNIQDIIGWVVGKATYDHPMIRAFEDLQQANSAREVCQILNRCRMPHETIPTEFKNSPEVWQTLLEQGVPVTALVRNLGNITSYGTLGNEAAVSLVIDTLSPVAVAKSRIHPLQVLDAAHVYAMGKGVLGSNEWKPVPQILNHLQKVVAWAFETCEPANRRFRLGVDVSGSMTTHKISGSIVTSCASAATAVALVINKFEPLCDFALFSETLMRVNIDSELTLLECERKMFDEFGGFGAATNIGSVIQTAIDENVAFDCFLILSDMELNMGYHPMELIEEYRRRTGIPAKVIACNMKNTRRTVVDTPDNDPYCLDIVGFDPACPELISEFARM